MSVESTISRIEGELQEQRQRKENRKRMAQALASLRSIKELGASVGAEYVDSVKGGYTVRLSEDLAPIKGFVPTSKAKRHGTFLGQVLKSRESDQFLARVEDVHDNGTAILSALGFLETVETCAKLEVMEKCERQPFVVGTVVRSHGGAFFVKIGEKYGFSVDGRLDYAEARAEYEIGDSVWVVPSLTKAGKVHLLEYVPEPKVQYPRGYRPPKREEKKDQPFSVTTMGAKQLRDWLKEAVDGGSRFSEEDKENLTAALRKRDDWPVRHCLRGSADWPSEYERLVAE